jgi:hypothetical protein
MIFFKAFRGKLLQKNGVRVNYLTQNQTEKNLLLCSVMTKNFLPRIRIIWGMTFDSIIRDHAQLKNKHTSFSSIMWLNFNLQKK